MSVHVRARLLQVLRQALEAQRPALVLCLGQAGGIAHKPGLGVGRSGAGLRHRQLIGVGAQDGLDGAVIRAVVGHGAATGQFESLGAVGLCQSDHALCRAQTLHFLQQLRFGLL